MSTPFLGEIRVFSFGFAPKGWAMCNGQLLPINENQALFALLGTTFGGDGRTTFGLPNLLGRVPMHQGGTQQLGTRAGEEAHTLTQAEMPTHTHSISGRAAANTGSPDAALWAGSTANAFAASSNTTMMPSAVSTAGGSQPHENRPPFLAVQFAMAVQGIFPSRN
jgi:microcystin-dependent protein